MNRKTSRLRSRGMKLMALGTVAAYSTAGLKIAQAQTTNGGEAKAAPRAQAPVQRFDIPAGTLEEVLAAFTRATGVQVELKLPKGSSFNSSGVTGTYSNAAALRALLQGTGLTEQFLSAQKAEVSIRNSETVSVTASSVPDAVALQTFTQPLLDTAQTVSVVPQFVLQEQAATTLRDGLRNVPGIAIAAGEGGSQGDNLTIRGFSARNDIFLDGIRDFGSYYRDSFDFESIDVLQGPASVEFGRGSTGGVVNQESKHAQMNDFVGGSLQLGTNAMRRATLDFNKPLTDFIQGAAVRVNLVGEETNVAGRDIANTRRFGIAPSLAFGLNTPTRYTIDYLHEDENSTPDYGLPYFGPAPAPVPHNTYYGFVSDSYMRTSPDVITGRIEHDVNANTVVRNVFRWANYPRDVRITEPQINTVATSPISVTLGAPITVKCAIAATAAASCYPLSTDPSLVTVKRNQLTSQAIEDTLWDQVSGSTRFSIGRIENDAVVTLEGGRERSRPLRNSYTVPYVSMVNPNPYDAFTPTTLQALRTHVETQSFGIGFTDTLKLAAWLQASGGVRFDYFNTHAVNAPAAGATTPFTFSNRLDKQPTYRAALVAKPRPAGSVYFDWGTSFNPSAESLSLSANNATSPPEYNETFELGAKWAFLRDRLNLSGSLFHTEKLNARETDPNNSANTINSGNQLVRGIQMGAIGHMPSHFDLILGYAFLDNKVESSILNASPFAAINLLLIAAHDPRANTAPYFISPKNYPLANVPKNSGNFWLTHGLWWHVVGGFGGNYVAARRASSTSLIGIYNNQNPIDPANVPLVAKAIPGYTLLNLMVRRPVSDRIDFQVNVNNITNKFFIEQPHPNHLVPGEGVNAQFGLNYKF